MKGKVITARGPVEPDALGAVLMHEHLHCACQTWEEGPTFPEREKLLMEYAVPNLKLLNDSGCHAIVDPTPPPWRAWPDTYVKVSEAANIHIILSTGFYTEMKIGEYWIKTRDDQIWPYVREAPVEELTEMCIREITEGLHGTDVHAGCVKLGTRTRETTPIEAKCFRAGAAAQKATGVPITTHCLDRGAHHEQLTMLEKEGVDLTRVTIGHTGHAIVGENASIREWMKRGANFLPTNLRMDADWEFIEQLVNAIRDLFADGFGDRLVLGLDWAFDCEQGPFVPCSFMPPPPFRYMFTNTLPRFRKLGLEEEAIETMLVKNPKRIIPVS